MIAIPDSVRVRVSEYPELALQKRASLLHEVVPPQWLIQRNQQSRQVQVQELIGCAFTKRSTY